MVDVRHLDRGQLAQLAHDLLDQATDYTADDVVSRSTIATAGVGYALLAGLAPSVEIDVRPPDVTIDRAFARRFAESAADRVPPDDVPEQTPARSTPASVADTARADLRYLLTVLVGITDDQRAKLRRAVDVLDAAIADGTV